MENKHFSHHHPLAFHHLPQPSHHHCSGCKSPATGNIFACWQCNYFLHDQCFRATRSLKHPSHPLHPLTLVPFPTYPSSSFFCNSCNLAGDAFSYTCSACEFDLHLHCALTPTPNPNPLYPPPISNPNSNPNPLYPPSHPNPNSLYPPPNSNQHQPHFPIPQNPLYPPPNPNSNPNPNPYPPQNPPTTQHYPSPPTAYPTPQNHAPPPPPPLQPTPTAPTDSTIVNAAAKPPETTTPQTKPPSIIKHFSHPHVLKQMEIEKAKPKVCSACEIELTGAAYCCTEPYCAFNLHKSCFDSPREVKHKSHLQHPLTLLTAPPYSDGFTCNACLKDGKAFAYNCATCSYDLHIDCIQWPDKVSRPDHKHDLTLYYSSPAAEAASEAAAFVCDVCRNPVHEMAWLYLCRECDFGTHLECVASGIQPQGGGAGVSAAAQSEEEELLLKFAVLQLLLGAQDQRSSKNLK